MTAVLAFLTRFWQPVLALVALACVTMAIRGYGEHRFEAGRADVIASDAAAITKLKARVAELEATNQKMAAAAHAAYEVEHAQTLIAARQPLTARELCGPADAGGGRVPTPGTAQPGDAAEPAAAGVVSEMPPRNSGVSSDRLRLLQALGGMAEDDSAVIRQWKARDDADRRRRSLAP